MILFPFIILSLLYKKIDKKSICFITIFENESKSRNKYHIFSGSTRFDNFSTKNNQKKSTSIKRGEIRKQAKSLKSSRLWTAGKQVTTE